VQCLILVVYPANLNPQMQLKAQIMYAWSCLIMMSVLYVIEFGLLLNYQVAGLTNNSYIAEAHEVRHCVQKYKTLGKYVLKVAKVLNKLFKWDSYIHLVVASHTDPFFNTITVCAFTYCRRDWIICCTLALQRNTENLQRNLQMWLVLKWYHSSTHQMLAWKLLIIQVSVVLCKTFSEVTKAKVSKILHNLENDGNTHFLMCVKYHILKWSLGSTFGVDIYSLGYRLWCIFIEIWHWSCTCTTERSSFSNSDPDSIEHQVRSVSLMEELCYWNLNMESILTTFLTVKQNSTLNREGSEVTSSEGGEATESNVILFSYLVWMFHWLAVYYLFLIFKLHDDPLFILDDCWRTNGCLWTLYWQFTEGSVTPTYIFFEEDFSSELYKAGKLSGSSAHIMSFYHVWVNFYSSTNHSSGIDMYGCPEYIGLVVPVFLTI